MKAQRFQIYHETQERETEGESRANSRMAGTGKMGVEAMRKHTNNFDVVDSGLAAIGVLS